MWIFRIKILLGFYRLLSTLLLIASIGLVLSGCQKNNASPKDAWQAIQERGYLRVGATYNFPPQGFLDEKSNPQGFEIDLIHVLAKEMLKKEDSVKLTEATNANWQGLLGFGQVDFLLSSMSNNANWSDRYDYSTPYFESSFRILVREKSGINHLSDLKGRRVTFLFGGTSEDILKKHAPAGTILVGFRTLNDETEAFKNGRVDAFAQQEYVLKNVLKQGCDLQLLPEKLSTQPFSVMFQRSQKNIVLREKVQTALSALKTSGELARIQKKWYINPPMVKCSGGKIF